VPVNAQKKRLPPPLPCGLTCHDCGGNLTREVLAIFQHRVCNDAHLARQESEDVDGAHLSSCFINHHTSIIMLHQASCFVNVLKNKRTRDTQKI